jgi:hypothetical protein
LFDAELEEQHREHHGGGDDEEAEPGTALQTA